MKILFVENHARFARITAQQFLAAHEVTIVSSLAAARKALLIDSLDVVLLDYDLDDGKGDELARELSTRITRPAIIAVSSHQAGNNALLSAGADAVCDKLNFKHIEGTLATLETISIERAPRTS